MPRRIILNTLGEDILPPVLRVYQYLKKAEVEAELR